MIKKHSRPVQHEIASVQVNGETASALVKGTVQKNGLRKNLQMVGILNVVTFTQAGVTPFTPHKVPNDMCWPSKYLGSFIDVCVDIYVMMSSDLYGTCSNVDIIVMSRTNSNQLYGTQRGCTCNP